jgi:hypothetical protein
MTRRKWWLLFGVSLAAVVLVLPVVVILTRTRPDQEALDRVVVGMTLHQAELAMGRPCDGGAMSPELHLVHWEIEDDVRLVAAISRSINDSRLGPWRTLTRLLGL